MGLQGMYGPAGLSNLLGITQPGNAGAAQPTAVSQPQNAFSEYASGSYGQTTPADQEANRWQSYLDANPDLMQHYSQNNVANSRHLLGGGGKGTDLDGDGAISPTEFAQYHYQTHGQSEGRGFGESAAASQPQNAFTGGASPNVVADGMGGYSQTGEGSQLAQIAPAATDTGGTQPIGAMTETLRQTPGYQFLQDESARAVENSFASRGELLSGAAVDALNTRTLGLADQTYQQSVNNNFNLANLGLGSAAQISNAGTNFANASGSALTNIGNAQANSAIGQANAFSNGLQGVSDSIMGGVGLYGASQGWF
jgi:hypothetical protein